MLASRALRRAAFAMIVPGALSGQISRGPSVDWPLAVGSEGERYLRVLELAGMAPSATWTVRGWSAGERRRVAPTAAEHPWSSSMRVRDTSGVLQLLAPSADVVFNSRFPYGSNDGAVWAGRGLTTSAGVGAVALLGPLEVTLSPVAFRAENSDFPLLPNGLSGTGRFANGVYPRIIDVPQRFGDGPYQRVDPGASGVRISGYGLTAGVTTASEWWGPALENPFLLGNHAPGFLHALLGTDRPVHLGFVTLNARAIAGRLEQSEYSTALHANRRRYVSGAIATLGIRQLPHLEIGASRFIHNIWPDSGVSIGDVLAPILQGPFKIQRARAIGTVQGDEADNQLASAFFRWSFPGSGFEIFGEFGREDNSYDTRDLIAEPDHISTYLLGFQRVWKRSASRLVVLRAEVLDARVTHLEQVRGQSPLYVHFTILQGHTQLGQTLGAPGAFGGESSVLGLDIYSAGGRNSVAWTRTLNASGSEVVGADRLSDVVHALTWERLLLRKRADVRHTVTFAYNFNRNQQGDALNLRLGLGFAPHW